MRFAENSEFSNPKQVRCMVWFLQLHCQCMFKVLAASEAGVTFDENFIICYLVCNKKLFVRLLQPYFNMFTISVHKFSFYWKSRPVTRRLLGRWLSYLDFTEMPLYLVKYVYHLQSRIGIVIWSVYFCDFIELILLTGWENEWVPVWQLIRQLIRYFNWLFEILRTRC